MKCSVYVVVGLLYAGVWVSRLDWCSSVCMLSACCTLFGGFLGEMGEVQCVCCCRLAVCRCVGF